jgi:hypothetical protein
MWPELFNRLLQLANEILTAGIVVVCASLLLYNLSRGLRNRVIRTGSVLLGAVTIVSLGDVMVALGPSSRPSVEAWLRFQWIGIAFVPAALFHLSDALLATTGRVSRWRRRLAVRLLYVLGTAFMFAAATSDQVIHTLTLSPAPHLKAGGWFAVFVLYAVLASALALFNVIRARRRCLTISTRRRMAYMLYSILTPLVGLFPYTSLVNGPAAGDGAWFWLLVNLSNVGVILMLSFMAYPLSFFGSEVPDRVIKAELLEFFLRGPFVGVATLAVIIALPRAGDVLGLPGREFMPLAAVAGLIVLEWCISRVLPTLEDWLIYRSDKDEMRHIRGLSERLLTRSDLEQLFEGILASACDYLRVSTAFVVSATADRPALEQSVGPLMEVSTGLESEEFAAVLRRLALKGPESHGDGVIAWNDFWLIPLWSENRSEENGQPLVGVMGVRARTPQPELAAEEESVLSRLAARAARALRDMLLQAEVFGNLETLMPKEEIEYLRWVTRYRGEPGEVAESIVGTPDFASKVKAALSHYWGGPRLTQSELLNLRIVQEEKPRHNGNAGRALGAVLSQAVESLRPEGVRSMTAAEWTLYNILEMRFVQGRKVRDVAMRLAMSESDFYRKQRAAIGEVARVLAEMESATQ